MGEFIAVSAFQTDDPGRVLNSVTSFFAAHGWPAEQVPGDGPQTDNDVLGFVPHGGWSVVLWPGYFSDLAAVEFVSRELGVVGSTVRIHDGDYWSHSLLRDGAFLDRFASMPDYFTDDRREIDRLVAKFAGQPAVVAAATGCAVEEIAPYLIHIDLSVDEDDESFDEPEPELGRAFPDDEYELHDPWVFVDFWRRIGIRYPADSSAPVWRLRLAEGWLNSLPAGDAEL
ncbi:hypothetical protein [Asanoa siamensis]|uniref:Uncharacterized protein n=1 Tax=Asanoa siamensis TaxID=926357 RepID=A0ABQ4CI73_9ACTN|nr:hypothetical protein [Asanoa siamensis]GIF70961.1 hypothetical protein Asi02nite_04790 [Asanoa siamensis]